MRPAYAPISHACLEAGARGAHQRGFVLFGDPGGEHRQHERVLGGEKYLFSRARARLRGLVVVVVAAPPGACPAVGDSPFRFRGHRV